MIATLSFMEDAFERFNKEFFDNALPKPTLQLSTDSKYMGTCYRKTRLHADGSYYYRYIIECSMFFDCPLEELENTMIHEMCHLWVYVNYPKTDEPSHGPIWQSIADKVTQASGKKYYISPKSTNDELIINDEIARNGYKSTDEINLYAYKIMVGTPNYGKWFCFACSPNSIEYFDQYIERLRKSFKLSSAISGKITRKYLSKCPNTYPLCRTSPRGKYINENTFEKNIKPHIEEIRFNY